MKRRGFLGALLAIPAALKAGLSRSWTWMPPPSDKWFLYGKTRPVIFQDTSQKLFKIRARMTSEAPDWRA